MLRDVLQVLAIEETEALVQRNERLVVLMSMPSIVTALPSGSSAILSFSNLSDGEWRGETIDVVHLVSGTGKEHGTGRQLFFF